MDGRARGGHRPGVAHGEWQLESTVDLLWLCSVMALSRRGEEGQPWLPDHRRAGPGRKEPSVFQTCYCAVIVLIMKNAKKSL